MATVEREITIPATPAEVWPAVTRSDEVSLWFGADVELDVRPGGRGVFRWPDGTERHAVVEEVEPEHRLSFRWLPFPRVRVVERTGFAVRATAGVAPASRWPVVRSAVDRRAAVRAAPELAAIDA